MRKVKCDVHVTSIACPLPSFKYQSKEHFGGKIKNKLLKLKHIACAVKTSICVYNLKVMITFKIRARDYHVNDISMIKYKIMRSVSSISIKRKFR